MPDNLEQRIEKMYRRDCRGAWSLIILLWITVLFILFMTWSYMPNGVVRIVALIGAAAVLLFNTSSIYAMVRHYAEDKEFIYGLDIKHLDAVRRGED